MESIFTKLNYRVLIEAEEVSLSFSLRNDSKGTYINCVRFTVGEYTVKLQIPDRAGKVQFEINDQIVETESVVRWEARSFNNILPTFVFTMKEDRDHIRRLSISDAINDSIFNFVRQRSDKRLRNFNRVDSYIESWVNNKADYLGWLKNCSPITSFRHYVSNWEIDTPEFIELFNMMALESMLPVWEFLDSELSLFYRNCSYIAPTRAEANRYYRTQGLQVSDIDPYGKNLPEFISSLSPMMQHSYYQYTEKVLGVRVRTKAETGHQSIMVFNEKGEFNITDIGFGYSQILPIVTKLWYSSQSNLRYRRVQSSREAKDNIILMEQPELHLHPAYQAKIADALIGSVTEVEDANYCLRLIAETHSDTILNRIGRRVREGLVKPEDVNIILFEKKPGEPTTQLRQTTYNEKGQIKEWPFGFFDPDQD